MALSPDQIAALRTDLAEGPLAEAIASAVTHAQDETVADAFNAAGTDPVSLASTGKNEWLRITTPAAIRLKVGLGTDTQSLGAGVVAKWSAVLEQGRAADPSSLIDLTMIGSGQPLGDPVAEKVMTSDEFAALTTKANASRAEVLFGAGVSVTSQDVAKAR